VKPKLRRQWQRGKQKILRRLAPLIGGTEPRQHGMPEFHGPQPTYELAERTAAVGCGGLGFMLRIQKAEGHRPLPYTALGWKVPDIAAELAALRARGVTFERFPGLAQDAQGIWSAPSGARIAWFKDPDGNVLSLAQF
jgi:catechol 2,3-dioxygenase-like lactoylglutathione lyase family enzyme